MDFTRRARSVIPRVPPLRRVLQRILMDHDVLRALSVVVVDDDAMTELHDRFLGKPTSTDVLSFPLGDPHAEPDEADSVFGEVVVSADTACREAERRGLSAERELALYAIHGTLHLVGYDDVEPSARRAMRRKERAYLGLWKTERGDL